MGMRRNEYGIKATPHWLSHAFSFRGMPCIPTKLNQTGLSFDLVFGSEIKRTEPNRAYSLPISCVILLFSWCRILMWDLRDSLCQFLRPSSDMKDY